MLKERMRILGADVRPAVSGSKTLKDATNEAMRHWINNPDDTHYIIGSVVGPHPYPDMVARFQSVISKELIYQLKKVENRNYPDFIIACVGGGSNAAGILKFNRVDSSKISFLLSIPALAGASVLSLKDVFEQSIQFNYLVVIAIISSFIFSFLTVKFFLIYINKFSMNAFVIYRIIIALILFSLIY